MSLFVHKIETHVCLAKDQQNVAPFSTKAYRVPRDPGSMAVRPRGFRSTRGVDGLRGMDRLRL